MRKRVFPSVGRFPAARKILYILEYHIIAPRITVQNNEACETVSPPPLFNVLTLV